MFASQYSLLVRLILSSTHPQPSPPFHHRHHPRLPLHQHRRLHLIPHLHACLLRFPDHPRPIRCPKSLGPAADGPFQRCRVHRPRSHPQHIHVEHVLQASMGLRARRPRHWDDDMGRRDWIHPLHPHSQHHCGLKPWRRLRCRRE